MFRTKASLAVSWGLSTHGPRRLWWTGAHQPMDPDGCGELGLTGPWTQAFVVSWGSPTHGPRRLWWVGAHQPTDPHQINPMLYSYSLFVFLLYSIDNAMVSCIHQIAILQLNIYLSERTEWVWNDSGINVKLPFLISNRMGHEPLHINTQRVEVSPSWIS